MSFLDEEDFIFNDFLYHLPRFHYYWFGYEEKIKQKKYQHFNITAFSNVRRFPVK